MSAPSSSTSSASLAPPRRVAYDDDDDDNNFAPDTTEKRASWKTNPFVPLGAFGGAVLLGVGIVAARRNSGWNLSQTIMQARVGAQAAAVAGLVGLGAYASYETKRKDEEENARTARLQAKIAQRK